MRRALLFSVYLLSGCASRYTVKVPVLISERPSSYEAGCLAAMHNAATTNKSYREKLNSKVYKPVIKSGSDKGDSCAKALKIIGIANQKNRHQLERNP